MGLRLNGGCKREIMTLIKKEIARQSEEAIHYEKSYTRMIVRNAIEGAMEDHHGLHISGNINHALLHPIWRKSRRRLTDK